MKRSTSAPSPLSPIAWPSDGFSWWRSLVAIVCVLFGLLLAGVLQYVYIAATGARLDGLRLNWDTVALQMLTYVPVVPILLGVLPWAARTSLPALGLRALRPVEVLAGVAGGATMFLVVLGLGALQSWAVRVQPEQLVVKALSTAHAPAVIAAFAVVACVVAPIAEELAFRGLLFNALRRYLPFWPAAVLSGLGFAAAHATPTALVPLWGGGIVLAYVYARTGALGCSMISHGTFNLINVALIVVFHQTS